MENNELCHYKYIKKEYRNGKWRYWYENDTSLATQLKRDREAAEKRAKAKAEADNEAAVKEVIESGVLDNMSDEKLDALAFEIAFNVKVDYASLTKEDKRTLVGAWYVAIGKITGMDPVTYAKLDIGDLSHSGIKGMKWGVRRYQNKDGTLTEAGKKRYARELAKLKAEEKVLKNRQKTKAQFDKLEEKKRKLKDLEDELDGKKPKPTTQSQPEPKQSYSPLRKPVKEISDDELANIVRRLENEKKYEGFYPEKVSKGKKFAEGMWDKAIQPALQEVAKDQIKSFLNSAVDGKKK